MRSDLELSSGPDALIAKGSGGGGVEGIVLRPENPARILELSPAQSSRLWAWSVEAAPREACGFLLGRAREAHVEVSVVLRSENLATSEDRFEVDPGEIVAAERDAIARGLELVGFWHSHPRAGAVPSAEDLRGAWRGHAFVIVGLRDRPEVRAWRAGETGFIEDVLAPRGALRVAEIPYCRKARAENASISPLRSVTATIEP